MRIAQFLARLSLAALALVSSYAPAAPAGHTLVYIDPQEYEHETRLFQYYYAYWFNQGEAVEPIALDVLRPVLGDVAMCEGNQAADLVVWLKPRMFYNPKMTTYYATMEARVYSGSGGFLGIYKEEAQRSGFLDVRPAEQIARAYRMAMQKVATKLQADAAVKALVEQGLPKDKTAMPCSMVTIIRPNNSNERK
jgi:hypothetical protein